MRKKKLKYKKLIFILIAISSVVIIIFNFNKPKSKEVSENSTNSSDTQIVQKLKKMVKQDSRIETIISNYEQYPEELLEMLSNNIDMVDFVIDYPEKKGNVYADNVGEVTKGTIPLLLQWDQRWGYANYGNSSIAVSGCGPTVLSMVITGLTGDNTITPYVVAKYAQDNGYYVSGSGSSWTLMSKGAKHFGIIGKEMSLSKESIFSTLKAGIPIICSMRSGDFTSSGHFIVLTGIKNGKIQLNDPNSEQRSHQLWDYERLESQINNLWSFTIK